MHWRFIEYKTNPGKFNMDYDMGLVNNIKDCYPVLRFYGWEPKCISIGANQSMSEINSLLAEKENIDIVKRPTGGRAILHAEELTYSVVISTSDCSGREIYEKISRAIVAGLHKLHPLMKDVQLENVNPRFSDLLNNPSGSICFASTAKSEIKFKGKKLVGSAQRKLGDKILQHGSILVGPEHKKLVNFLNVNKTEKNLLLKEMEEKTTELSGIIGENIDVYSLQNHIVDGFKKVFNADFIFETLETC
jgi:lipoate-protein ligase A